MKISIVTPSYNQGAFIERTMQSVASQATEGLEIEHVIFDGGSTDNTVQILQRTKLRICWVSKKDKGQADAVNQAIRATDGEIIGWLNSDDIYYPRAIERVAAYFNSHPEVDVLYGMADHIDLKDHAFEDYPTSPWNFDKLKESCFICQPALFLRRRVVEEHGLLDQSLNYCMDYEYWLRLGINGACFAYLEEKLAGSRLYAENKTLASAEAVHIEINNMLKKLLGKVPDKWLFNYAHTVLRLRFPKNGNKIVFSIAVGVLAIAAALRWNRCVSLSMCETIIYWFAPALKLSHKS